MSQLNGAISDFQTIIDEEPRAPFVHLVFNWHSEEQMKDVVPHIDCHTLFPSMVITVDPHAPPLVCNLRCFFLKSLQQFYEAFQSYCRRLGVNDTRVFTHTIWGEDVKKCEDTWQSIWDITTKGPPAVSSDSDSD